jgi:hypothetical protein
MDQNLARWIYQSVVKHFESTANGISLPYFVEGVHERTEANMRADHVEIRVTGPELKELSKGYYDVKVIINVLFTKNMTIRGADAFDIIQWTGVFSDVMLDPIQIYKAGTGAGDDGSLIGCLRVDKDRNAAVRVYHFGQLDKDTRIRQSEVDAEYGMTYQTP